MMLSPSLNELLDKAGNRYLLVNIVSKRAREIASMADENKITLPDKPVKLAIAELNEGKLHFQVKIKTEKTN